MHACNRSRSASMMGCKILIRAYIPRWPVKHALMLQTMNPAIQAMHSLHGSEARSTARPTSLRQRVGASGPVGQAAAQTRPNGRPTRWSTTAGGPCLFIVHTYSD